MSYVRIVTRNPIDRNLQIYAKWMASEPSEFGSLPTRNALWDWICLNQIRMLHKGLLSGDPLFTSSCCRKSYNSGTVLNGRTKPLCNPLRNVPEKWRRLLDCIHLNWIAENPKTDFRLLFGTVHFLFSLQGVVYSRPQQR
jgi:hypothetical protein